MKDHRQIKTVKSRPSKNLGLAFGIFCAIPAIVLLCISIALFLIALDMKRIQKLNENISDSLRYEFNHPKHLF